MANASILAAFERMWFHVVAKLGNKVDKVDGMGLSTNDYTTEEKNKLTAIQGLPTVTTTDIGKFLRVSDASEWAVEALPNAEDGEF